MASGFFAILDDIAALMDDVAVTTKVAAGKTAGILGDDLAVNAEKATGFVSSRELPVLWAITKGSLLNKLIILPAALLLQAFYPPAIRWILVCGGFYLAYEGVEKILEFLFHRGRPVVAQEPVSEQVKIKSAITTDFILSIEIVIIALGTVLDAPLVTQILTVALTALLATIGVYGIVALIVRMDDAGLRLMRLAASKGWLYRLGAVLVKALPIVIRWLGVIGTLALVLVSGGILVHQLEVLHHWWPIMPGLLKDAAAGLAAGLLAATLVTVVKRLFSRRKPSNA